MLPARTSTLARTSSDRMSHPFRIQLLLCLALLLLAARSEAWGQKVDPAVLPARESHQGLLIAVSADVTAERSKAKFGKRTPYEAGVLGLDVYFRNDNDAPIRINLEEVRLFIGSPDD